jgi:protein-S-isoprenylcysteine O-methyltransferase Ste14
MSVSTFPDQQDRQEPSNPLVRLGGWFFRKRSALPIPFIVALLALPPFGDFNATILLVCGLCIVAAGEGTRLWAVRQIGVISRTRSDRLGPLVSTGPFGYVRNPLYLGNIAIWTGFAVSARILWLAPAFLAAAGFVYHAIVLWEEQLLASRRGQEYREYAARVSRWVPGRAPRTADHHSVPLFSWRDTLASERSTLMAVAGGLLLLWAKSRWQLHV